MIDATWTKNGYVINRWNGYGTKGGYNKDIENGESKCNKYRKNYNINKNKYHIFNCLIVLINNFIYFIKNKYLLLIKINKYI